MFSNFQTLKLVTNSCFSYILIGFQKSFQIVPNFGSVSSFSDYKQMICDILTLVDLYVSSQLYAVVFICEFKLLQCILINCHKILNKIKSVF